MSGQYRVEIISVGTELLQGHVTNTDARDISEALGTLGMTATYHTVVGDCPADLARCVQTAKERTDIIITTGGLGPTCDDLTKQVLAECFGKKLVENEAEKQSLYNYMHPEQAYTENNASQAMLPEGCTVFHNNCGTAPGCGFAAEGKHVVMLPGPPKECMAMLRESALPYLQQLADGVTAAHDVHIYGLGESQVDDIFAAEMCRMVNPAMAPFAKECDCLLRITAKAADKAAAEQLIAPVIAHVQEVLGEYVYGVDTESIEEAVIALLQAQQKTFAAAESCTGGEIAKRFTDLPGASSVFMGGVVTYTNEAKVALLGIDPLLIDEKSAVSYEVAKAMAENVRRVLGTDLGIGVTGVAGPATDGSHPVGTVFIAMAAEEQTWVYEAHMGEKRSRSFIRRNAGNIAYDMMRRYLSGLRVL